MQHSEFWETLERLLGSAYGRSLAADLYLPAFGTNAQDALSRGESPDAVWVAFCAEAELGEGARWAHREERRRPRR